MSEYVVERGIRISIYVSSNVYHLFVGKNLKFLFPGFFEIHRTFSLFKVILNLII